ncbi:MAG: hypothetical protein K5644_04525 [Lachnospiraceae bacterium]|nr:hypothetical protein [Lachnospiraceae bacterium]
MRSRSRFPRLDKSLKKQIIIAVIIFIVAFIVFAIIFNARKTYASDDMSDATLPTISSRAFDNEIGQLHGYKDEMDACYMRDSVIPLSSNRELPLNISAHGNKIDSISYEIRSTDMERKIAETNVTEYTQTDGGDIDLNIKIENLTEEGTEYLFIIKLETGGETVHYYTRILIPVDCHEKELFDFIKYFHDTSLHGNYNDLAMYLETSPNANQDTLAEVTLASSAYQIGFGGLEATEATTPIMEVKDINSDYCVYEITYQLQLGEGNTVSYFNVKEYYKVRYTQSRIFILDYRRNMEEIINKDHVVQDANTINLGITSSDINYLSNETGTITCFEQGGELFEYNQNKGKLIKLFSFLDGNVNDSRNFYDSHSIKILEIDENGCVNFAVYGYMNRGPHEGHCGIDLYKYDASTGKTIEEAFVATTCSYQILKASFSDLLYKANDKYFYVMIAGNLVKINLNNDTMENVLEGLNQSQYAASKSGRFIAYTTTENRATSLTVMDLSDESSFTIDAEEDQYIRPLAFMDDDLVYGIVNASDIEKNIAGATIYPVSDIYIMQVNLPSHPILKHYHKDGYFVTDAILNSYTLTLERVTKTDTGYAPADVDTIKNASGEAGRAVDFIFKKDPVRGEITILKSAKPDDQNPIPAYNYEKADISFMGGKNTITVNANNTNDEYFVYVGSQVLMATHNTADAIKAADEQMGIVVDNNSSYIWKRGRKSYVNAFSGLHVGEQDAKADTISKCISTMLVKEGLNVEVNTYIEDGDGPYEILKSIMKNYTVLDLTGCNLTQVLYYVSQGSPVLAITGPNDATLIVGYDSGSIATFNPNTGAYSRLGLMEASAMFEANNNAFISYIKR